MEIIFAIFTGLIVGSIMYGFFMGTKPHEFADFTDEAIQKIFKDSKKHEV